MLLAHVVPGYFAVQVSKAHWPPQQVTDGGLWGYLTHSIFLLEPMLLSTVVIHYFGQRSQR